jgi:hypothetical protein
MSSDSKLSVWAIAPLRGASQFELAHSHFQQELATHLGDCNQRTA